MKHVQCHINTHSGFHRLKLAIFVPARLLSWRGLGQRKPAIRGLCLPLPYAACLAFLTDGNELESKLASLTSEMKAIMILHHCFKTRDAEKPLFFPTVTTDFI